MKAKILVFAILLLSILATGPASFGPIFKSHDVKAAGTATLTVQPLSPVGGTVTGTGINCGSDCTETYAAGTTISMTTSINSGRRLAYWTNGYTGTICNEGNTSTTCTFTINADMTLKTVFDFNPTTLNISKRGTGSGTVTGAGFSCGTDCSESYSLALYPNAGSNTIVALTATPSAGSVFAGWQTDGDACVLGGGKSGPVEVNPSTSCSAYVGTLMGAYTAVAQFDKIAGATTSTGSSAGSPSTTQSTTATTKPSATSTTNSPAAAAVTTGSPVEIQKITVEGKSIDITKPLSISESKPLHLSGKTTPNGTVTLTIHSRTRTATVTADKEGLWSYTLSGLEPGSHRVEASVKDPSTNQSTPATQILAFTVTAAKLPTAKQPTSMTAKKSSLPLIGAISAVIVLAGVAVAFWYLRRKRTNIVTPPPLT